MKAKEFNIKKRDPNWQTMQAKGTSGAAGKHKDKKKAEKQGEVKHKKQVTEGADELYGIRIGDTVTTEFNGQKVQGDVIDLFPDDMKVELLLRGPESGRTVVVDVRDTEFFEDTDNDEPDEEYLDKVISDLHKDALGFRPDREFGREWMSSSFEEKLEIYNRLLKSLHSDIDEVMAYGTGFGSSSRSSFPRRRTSSMLSIMQRMKEKEKKKTPEVGDRIEFGQFNKPDSMKKATVVKVGDGGLTLTIKTDDGEQGNISLGNKSLSYKILEDDKETISLPFGTVTRPKPTVPAPITQRPRADNDKDQMPPKIKRLWDRIKQEPKLWAEVMNIIDEFDTLRDDEIEDEINAFLSSDTLMLRAVGIVLQYEHEKMKNESVREASDFGEPKEILSDVLSTLEREVEWPLTDVMEYEEVLRLLAPIKNAINDKLKSIGEAKDLDWGSMSHKEFKRRELEHELAGEEDRYQQAMKGDHYLRIDGKIWRKSGTPVVFSGKQAAEKAGMTILRKNPGKKISVVNKPIDESYLELSLEDRIDELKRGTGFLILKFREKELPEGEGRYLIGYGGFGETPDDVRLATAVIKEFKAEKFEDMRRKIFDLFKDKSFVGVEKIKINAPTSLIGKYPELEKLFSAAESGEFKKVEPIYSEPKEKISKKTEKYRIDPVTGKRERIKEPIKYGRGMSGRPGEPGEPTVRFSVTNPRLASMMKDQGLQFNQGKFTVSQSMYKKLLDALRDAEMIRKFGDVTTLIKDKEIIENDETV